MMATITNLSNKDWEQIPGTGTAPYNPPKFRMKKEAKAKQRSAFKLKQAKKREEITKPSVEKVYSRAKKTTAGPARLYAAARRGVEEKTIPTPEKTTTLPPKKRTAAPMGISKTDIPVRRKEPKVTIKTLKGPLPSKKRTTAPMGMSSRDEEKARQRRYMLKTLKESPRGEPSKRVYPLSVNIDDPTQEWKTGGKVSRKKGSTVSRNIGSKVWNGNDEVAEGYDTI